MKQSIASFIAASLGAVWLGAMTPTLVAQELSVRGGFTGNWTDPVKNRQGIQIEVVDSRRAVVAWFTYDLFGEPTWMFGVGEIEGATIEIEMLQFDNGKFPPDAADPDEVMTRVWGDLTLTFDDCNNGQMSWEPALPDFEPGSVEIDRVSSIDGLRCGQAEEFEHEFTFNLDAGSGRWQGIFADFSEEQQDLIEEVAEWTTVPEPVSDRQGFKLAGTNRSDDLAMFMFAPVGGLMPATTYRVELDMTFATNVPAGCVGVGGPPGEGVNVKLGASTVEPEVELSDGELLFNFDKGNQSTGGEDAIVVGDMTNSQQCEDVGNADGEWELKTVTTRGEDFFATTDEQGRLWILGGTDSGFEARTTFYVTRIAARMRPVDEV